MPALIERSSAPRQRIAVEATDTSHLAATRKRLSATQRRWLTTQGFDAKPGSTLLLPDANGKLERVLVGVDATQPLAALAALPATLPEGTYQLAEDGVALDAQQAALGWALGAYQFTRYRKAKREPATLSVDAAVFAAVQPLVDATALVRDLVNTPTEDMGPEQIGDAIKTLGKTHKAKVRDWVGDELLKANFPTIHAVGRASHREPRLIELSWGKLDDPKLVLVGTTTMFFAVINAMKIVPYFMLGQFTSANLLTSIALLPVAIAANMAGIWLVRRTPTGLFYQIAYALLLVISVALLWQGFSGVLHR